MRCSHKEDRLVKIEKSLARSKNLRIKDKNFGRFFSVCGVLANGLASISIKIGATPYGLQLTVFIDISKSWPLMLGSPLFHGFKFLYLALSAFP